MLTINVWTFVINLSHGWLPISVRERQCGATTDICPQCTQSDTIVHRTRPGDVTFNKSSARTRQTARHRVELAYAHSPTMLAQVRRVFDIPWED
jgi:hypothetical protein